MNRRKWPIRAWRQAEVVRLAAWGRVNCPAHEGDVDVEDCLSCPFLLTLEGGEGIERIACAPPRSRVVLDSAI